MKFNFAFLLIFFVLTVTAQEENRKAVPGTNISLIPPDGFAVATSFKGFRHEETGSSIMITEIAGPVKGITESFTAEALKAKGMTLITKKTIDWNNTKATLVHLTQQGNGTTYYKHILITGNDKSTTLINGIYPEIAKDIEEDMMTALLSSRLN